MEKDSDKYHLDRVFNAGNIVLKLRRGFKKDLEQYEQLANSLKEDWDSRVKNPTSFNIGEHVLIKRKIEDEVVYNRGIVEDAYGDVLRDYDIFLCDEGEFEKRVPQNNVTALKDNRKNLKCRTVIIRLAGIVPARPIVDIGKLTLGTKNKEEQSVIYAQDSEWSRSTNREVSKWLTKDVKYLLLTFYKVNVDGSYYGNIFRITKTSSENESLVSMLLSNHLALENKALQESQLNPDPEPCKPVETKSTPLNGAPSPSREPAPVPSSKKSSKVFSHKDNESPLTYSSDYLNPKEEVDKQPTIKMFDGDIPGQLLVRGTRPKRRYDKLETLKLPETIGKALRVIGVTDLSELQKVVAPNFLCGSDLVVIAPDDENEFSKNARAMSYILPLFKVIYSMHENNRKETDFCNPDCIIICNSNETGAKLKEFIQSLLSFCHHIRSMKVFLGSDSKLTRFPRETSILILTINILDDLLQQSNAIKLFTKMRYLVFEELELYLETQFESMLAFITAARNNIRQSICIDYVPFQLVYSSSQWNTSLENLFKIIINDRAPVLVIDALNQVLRYADIKWVFHHVTDDDKRLGKLIQLIRNDCSAHHELVVVCSTPETSTFVYKGILGQHISDVSALLALSTNSLDELQGVDRIWRSDRNQRRVLITHDGMLQNLSINDGTCLICFDSPLAYEDPDKRKKFSTSKRFGYMWKNIRNISADLKKPAAELIKAQELESHFIVTGQETNFDSLYNFAKSLGARVILPPSLMDIGQLIHGVSVRRKPLCEGTKLFGFCNHQDPKCCNRRHEFCARDFTKTADAPVSGEVEVKIVKCVNPSLYVAQLLRHFEFRDGKRICEFSYINEMKRREKLMTEYYSKAENLNLVEDFEGMCAVLDPSTKIWARCQIVKTYANQNVENQPKAVKVFCVDTGHKLNPSPEDMYELAEEFYSWARLTVDLVLTNLRPLYRELNYRSIADKKARTMTMDKILQAKIWISSRNMLWVNPLVEYHLDPITRKTVKGNSIRMELISNDVVSYNGDHLKTLLESLCKHKDVYKGASYLQAQQKSALQEETVMLKEKFHYLGDSYRWAHLERGNKVNPNPAKFAVNYGFDPWLVFGVNTKNDDLVNDLNKELNAWVEKSLEDEQYKNVEEIFGEFYQINMIVAAKEREEKKWGRAMITNAHGDNLFRVFFVDVGDCMHDVTLKELFPVSHQFVNRLPFQVIAFSLDHVMPVGGGTSWTLEEEKSFLDIVIPESGPTVLDVTALDEIDNGDLVVDCHYYSGFALTEEGKEIGELLVSMNQAEFKHGKAEIVKDFNETMLSHYNDIVDRETDLGFEDEPEDGIFDVNIPEEFLTKMKDHLISEKAKAENVQSTIAASQSSNHGSNSEMKPGFSKAVLKNNNLPIKEEIEFKSYPKLPEILGDRRPNVIWRQTNNEVILTILVVDIQNFDVSIQKDNKTVSFKTELPAKYKFDITLYGKLRPEFQTHLLGQSLKIILKKKLANYIWSRLLFDKTEQHKWLKSDLNYIGDEDDEDDDAKKEKDLLEKIRLASKEKIAHAQDLNAGFEFADYDDGQFSPDESERDSDSDSSDGF